MTHLDDTHARQRRRRVAALLSEERVETLVVTTPSAIAYLTDVDPRGFATAPAAVLLDDGTVTLIVGAADRALVELAGYSGNVVYWPRHATGHPERALVSSSVRGSSDSARIAVDDPRVLMRGGDVRPAHPLASVVAAAPLLAAAMRLKDDEEIARLRAAADLADIAYTATVDRLHPGLRVYDIVRNVDRSVRAAGGGGWWSPDEGHLDVVATTSFPGGAIVGLVDRRPETGVLDPGAAVPFHLHPLARSYAGAAGTTVVFQTPDDGFRDRADRLSRGLQAAIDALGPGIRGDEVHRAFVQEAGGSPADDRESLTGYSIGTGMAELLVTPSSTTVLEPRMVICLRAFARGDVNRPGVVFQTTVLVTDQAAERLDQVVPLRLVELF